MARPIAEGPAIAALKVVFGLCKSEPQLVECAKINADAIGSASPEIQSAARAVYVQRRDEIRKETPCK
jgi:hypothetical protein